VQRTPDGGFAAVVIAGEFGHRLTGCVAFRDLLALARVEH
jgi:hypothetical protein